MATSPNREVWTWDEQLTELTRLTAEELERRAQKLIALARELRGEAAQLNGNSPPLEAEVEFDFTDEEPSAKREEGIVGRFGLVTLQTSQITAQTLGEFTRVEFAEKTGLKLSTAGPMLAQLIERDEIEFDGRTYISLKRPTPRDWIIRQEEPFTIEAFAKAIGVELEDAERHIEQWKHRRALEQLDGTGTFRYVPPNPREGPREHPTKAPEWKIPPSNVESRATGMPVRVSASQRATRHQRSVEGAGGIKGAKQRDRRYKEMQEKKEQKAAQRRQKAAQQVQVHLGRARRRKAKA